MIKNDKLKSQLNEMSESLQAFGMAFSKLHPYQKAAIDAARKAEEEKAMIAFDNDVTDLDLEEMSKLMAECFVSAAESLRELGAAFGYCAIQKRLSNAQEVVAWRKRKKTHAFKCFFKARVPIERKKINRPYKKRGNHEKI